MRRMYYRFTIQKKGATGSELQKKKFLDGRRVGTTGKGERATRPRWRGSARGPRQYKSMYRGIQRHQPCMANGAVGTGSERRYVLSRRSLIQAWPAVWEVEQARAARRVRGPALCSQSGKDLRLTELTGFRRDVNVWVGHPIPVGGELRCRCARDRPSWGLFWK